METKGWTYRPDQIKPYSVQISVNGKKVYLGSFATEEEAHKVAMKAREANPKQFSKGGRKPGFRHPKKPCDICGIDYTVPNLDIHRKACKKKAALKALKHFSKNMVVTYKGQQKSIAEFSEITGVSLSTVRERFYNGWSINRLFNPVHKKEN